MYTGTRMVERNNSSKQLQRVEERTRHSAVRTGTVLWGTTCPQE